MPRATQRSFQVAIDGPAGVGKSTTAQALATKLNFVRIDSGTLYRALTYIILQKHDNITKELLYTIKEEIQNVSFDVFPNRIMYDGVDIKPFLRQKDIETNVSLVAKQSYVRERIQMMQNTLMKNLDGVIIDGRDIGTVILPNADIKIYLTACEETRARRRWLENGKVEDFEKILSDMKKRDYDDIHRKHGPLRKAEDAIEIDNGKITFNEAVELIYELVQGKRSLQKVE